MIFCTKGSVLESSMNFIIHAKPTVVINLLVLCSNYNNLGTTLLQLTSIIQIDFLIE